MLHKVVGRGDAEVLEVEVEAVGGPEAVVQRNITYCCSHRPRRDIGDPFRISLATDNQPNG